MGDRVLRVDNPNPFRALWTSFNIGTNGLRPVQLLTGSTIIL